jgi:hypothetical protein
VADYLSRPHAGSSCTLQYEDGQQESVPTGVLVVLSAAWPTSMAKQADCDAVVCNVCQDPCGYHNMAICSGCDPLMLALALCHAAYVRSA